MKKTPAKFTVQVRYYSDSDGHFVWKHSYTPSSIDALKAQLKHDLSSDKVMNLYDANHDRFICTVLRTNIMVRDVDGNLVKWKHLLK